MTLTSLAKQAYKYTSGSPSWEYPATCACNTIPDVKLYSTSLASGTHSKPVETFE